MCPKRKRIPGKWYLHLHTKLEVLWRGEEIINVFQLSSFDTPVVLLESGLEEMQEGREIVDLSSDVFLVENFNMLYSFFIFAEKTKLGFQSVEKVLKNFQDYSV